MVGTNISELARAVNDVLLRNLEPGYMKKHQGSKFQGIYVDMPVHMWIYISVKKRQLDLNNFKILE